MFDCRTGVHLTVALATTWSAFGQTPATTPAKTDNASLVQFAEAHCFDCHGNGSEEGGLAIDTLLATRILAHTQVIDDEIAVLTDPDPEAFARGIDTIVSDRARARALGDNARRRSDQEYSYERYLDRTRRLLDFVSENLARPLPRETPAAME